MHHANDELRHRLARVRSQMRDENVDVVVGTRQATLSYLANTFLPWRSAVIVTEHHERLIAWEHDAERIKAENWLGPDAVHTYTRGEGFVAGLLRVLDELDARGSRLGLELGPPETAQLPPGAVTAAEYLRLSTAVPESQVVDALPLLDRAMVIKTAREIAALRKSAEIAQHGFEVALTHLRPGVLETTIAGVIEGEVRFAGNEWTWSVTAGTEVAAGERTAYLGGVTQPATRSPINTGDNVILDIHTMYDLYLADLAGNAVIGRPTPEQQTLRDAWKASLDRMLGKIRPGTRICDVTRPAFEVIDDFGLADVKVPLFGHGLGTCARTPPLLTLDNEQQFQSGMAMALGVHLYQPGVGGMRIEQPLVVTDSGAEPLCDIALDWHIVDA